MIEVVRTTPTWTVRVDGRDWVSGIWRKKVAVQLAAFAANRASATTQQGGAK